MNDQQHKRVGTGRLIAVALLAVLTVSATVAVASSAKDADEVDDAGSAARIVEAMQVTVLYEIEGTASAADVTVRTPNGGTEQVSGVKIPLGSGGDTVEKGVTYTYLAGEFLYLSAQNADEYGTLTCRITVNDKVISENTSSGAYTIVTCQGTT